MESIALILVCILMFCAYFLPALVANRRKHKNENAIFLTNLVFGWTVLGWLLALIWSTTSNVEVK